MHMKASALTSYLAAGALCLVLGACAANVNSTQVGGVTGAVVGGLVGSALTGSFTGAVVGAVVGGVAGFKISKRES